MDPRVFPALILSIAADSSSNVISFSNLVLRVSGTLRIFILSKNAFSFKVSSIISEQ